MNTVFIPLSLGAVGLAYFLYIFYHKKKSIGGYDEVRVRFDGTNEKFLCSNKYARKTFGKQHLEFFLMFEMQVYVLVFYRLSMQITSSW